VIGMSRENTNKQLRVWEKRGWVRLEHGTLVILDGRALSRIADDSDHDRDSLADCANNTMIADRRLVSAPVAPTSTPDLSVCTENMIRVDRRENRLA
jgi:hypothetical protein